MIALTIDALPRHVLDYTAFDAIVATHGTTADRRRWISASDDRDSRLGRAPAEPCGCTGCWTAATLLNGVEALFDLGPEPSDIGNPEKRGWQPMRMTHSRGYDPMRPLILTTDPNQRGSRPRRLDGIFYRQRDLGSIVISRYTFGDIQHDSIQLRDLDPATSALVWGTRHGVVPSAPSPSFPTLLIPDVGLAPIGEFQFLITLFVILIGPVLYWLLRRSGRLHLMILAVPAAALAVTATMFLYALFGDGLSARLRAFSYTRLDQQQGKAYRWARLSYYAGLAPAEGLAFPTDTAVYPVLPSGVQRRGRRSRTTTTRTVDWAGRQLLTPAG